MLPQLMLDQYYVRVQTAEDFADRNKKVIFVGTGFSSSLAGWSTKQGSMYRGQNEGFGNHCDVILCMEMSGSGSSRNKPRQ